MITIKVDDTSYRVDGELYPIPIGFSYEGRFLLVGRLLSTRGRRAAWWVAGKNWEPHLSAARYQPFLRCEVEGIVQEISAQTRDLLNEPDPEPDELYSCIRCWGQPRDTLIYIRAKLISSDRPLRKLLFEQLSLIPSLSFHQGNLTASFVYSESVDLSLVGYFYPHFPDYNFLFPRFLFNHEIFAPILIPFDTNRLVYSPHKPIKIVSPHHPLNPIQLEKECWWLLSHPIPTGDVD